MRGRDRGDYLFRQGQLSDVIRSLGLQLAQAVSELEQDYILNVGESELVEHLVDEYALDLPDVDGDPEIESDEEVDVDVSHDPNRIFFDEGPHVLRGRRVVVALRMKGRSELCKFRPNTTLPMVPKGEVEDGEIRLTYDVVRQDPAELRARIDQDVDAIKKHCEMDRGGRKTEPCDHPFRWPQALVPQIPRQLLLARLTAGTGSCHCSEPRIRSRRGASGCRRYPP